MRLKFNKYERVAGMFIVFAVVGALTVTGFVAIKRLVHFQGELFCRVGFC
ncbi:MAG: hypothetical protein R2827_02460 [Bdellovibrionales bacterium]